MTNTKIIPGAEPYFHQGNEVGCLVTHGFTASPSEVNWLAQYMAAQGYTVYTPLLAGHGTHYKDLDNVAWQDWLQSVRVGYELLAKQCDSIFIIGHSMGGVLSLMLATEVPAAGVVATAAPIALDFWQIRMARWLKYLLPYTTHEDRWGLNERVLAEQARRGEPLTGRIRYDIWSSAAVAELYAVMNATRQTLAQVTAPTLLIYSTADDVVPYAECEKVKNGLLNAPVMCHTLHESRHNLPMDVERETVFEHVGQFVREILAQKEN